tara:strand:- start:3802 stop:5196 length:1395 start_codon:yes stop_codon:yes gene_type:complete
MKKKLRFKDKVYFFSLLNKFFYSFIIKSIAYFLSKLLIFIFIRLLFKNNLSYFLFKSSYSFIYKNISYYLNLRSDLEAVQQLSLIRDKVIIYKKKNKVFNKKKKIIFILNVAKSNLVSFDHLKKFTKKFDLYFFEIEKNKEDNKFRNKFLKKNNNFLIKNNIKFEWYKRNFSSDNLSTKINKLNADLIIFDKGIGMIDIIDKINTKKIISINKTSLFVPHSKIDLQTFQQPPWPYRIQGNKIYNFKKKKYININVTEKIFVYRKTNIKIKKRDLKNKNIILWYGNLKKLADKNYIKSISKILKKYKNLNFYFFGTNIKYLTEINKYFEIYNVKNFKFLGNFSITNNKNLKNFKFILSRTLVMANTFAMHGGRYALEAYEFNIPIINFQLNDKQWLNNQNKMYYKNKNIFLKKYVASNYNEYESRLEKALFNKEYRNQIIKKQKVLFNKLTSNEKIYNDLNKFKI